MKKYLCLIGIFLMLTLTLAGCKKADDKTSYNKKDLQQVQKEVILALTQNQQPTFDMEKYPVSDKAVKNFQKNLKAIKKDCGQIKDIAKKSKVEYVSGDINVTTDLDCEKRDAICTAIFEYDAENDNKITLTDITFDAKYSTGEKLSQAGANTAIGMGTVFAVLIFIFLVISCFNLFPKVKEVIKRKKKMDDKGPRSFDTVKKSDGELDDEELVAVITAAIAATEKKSTDSFVVRSIKRR